MNSITGKDNPDGTEKVDATSADRPSSDGNDTAGNYMENQDFYSGPSLSTTNVLQAFEKSRKIPLTLAGDEETNSVSAPQLTVNQIVRGIPSIDPLKVLGAFKKPGPFR